MQAPVAEGCQGGHSCSAAWCPLSSSQEGSTSGTGARCGGTGGGCLHGHKATGDIMAQVVGGVCHRDAITPICTGPLQLPLVRCIGLDCDALNRALPQLSGKPAPRWQDCQLLSLRLSLSLSSASHPASVDELCSLPLLLTVPRSLRCICCSCRSGTDRMWTWGCCGTWATPVCR